jgi:putative membrane protein
MSEQESNRIRRIMGWGIVGLIAVIGLSVALSLYFVPQRLASFHYPFFFFPFHFGGLGAIFLILTVFFIVRRFFRPWREDGYYLYPHEQAVDATSIIRESYSKGEITKEQFEQMLRDLRQEDS